MDTASWYRRFGELEERGQSATYEDWTLGVAEDPPIIALIDELPQQKRQPNLVFACARLLGAPEAGYPLFRRWLTRHWPEVVFEVSSRSTQTNEVLRCASLMPALSLVPGPLALLEVGASAGLCLYPDRFSYSYNGGVRLDPPTGLSTVLLQSTTTGQMPQPQSLPQFLWRPNGCGLSRRLRLCRFVGGVARAAPSAGCPAERWWSR